MKCDKVAVLWHGIVIGISFQPVDQLTRRVNFGDPSAVLRDAAGWDDIAVWRIANGPAVTSQS